MGSTVRTILLSLSFFYPVVHFCRYLTPRLTPLLRLADLAGNQVIKFGIESKRSCPETSTEVFRNNLVEALREMRDICERGQPAGEEGKAKL